MKLTLEEKLENVKCKRKFYPVRTNSDGIGLELDIPGQKFF